MGVLLDGTVKGDSATIRGEEGSTSDMSSEGVAQGKWLELRKDGGERDCDQDVSAQDTVTCVIEAGRVDVDTALV